MKPTIRRARLFLNPLEDRLAPATIAWKTAASGNWSLGTNWLGDVAPGADDTAVIDAVGANYTVTLNADATVSGVTLNSSNANLFASGRTLTVNGPGTFTSGTVLWRNSTWAGTGTLTNTADMTVQGNSSISSAFVQNGNLLVQGSNGGGHTTLSVASGFTNAGTLTLKSIVSSYSSNLTVTTGALTISPTGVLTVDAGTGGPRILSADLINQGTVALNANTTFGKSGGSTTNTGAFTVAAGQSLTLGGGSGQNFQQSGGALTIAGTVSMTGGTFTLGGGTLDLSGQCKLTGATCSFTGGKMTTGTSMLYLKNSALHIGPGSTGVGRFRTTGSGATLSGDIAADQAVLVEGNNDGSHTTLTTTSAVTNSGALTLQSQISSYATNLNLTGGTLTISPTGSLNVNAGTGGGRDFVGNVMNNGAVAFNANVAFTKADSVFTNAGTTTVAAGKLLSMTKGGQTLAQAGGKWQVDGGVSLGNATVNLEGGTIAIAAAASFTMTDIATAPSTFNFKGGSHIGTPILLKTSGLNIMGATGAGRFILTGKSTLSGDIAAPQSVTVQGNNFGSHTTVTATNSITNAGTLTMKSIISAYSSNLTLTSGVLTISTTGVFSTEVGTGGTRELSASLINNGKMDINANTSFAMTGGSATNTGTFTVANGQTLTLGGGSSQAFQQNGGALNVAGTIGMAGGTFTLGGGTLDLSGQCKLTGATCSFTGGKMTTGTSMLYLKNSALHIGPGSTGVGRFRTTGSGATLSGDIAADQAVLVEGNNDGSHTTLTTTSAVTNSGALTLQSQISSYATNLNLTGGTLTISPTGSLNVNAGTGGGRDFAGNVMNNGAVAFNANVAFTKADSVFTNAGTTTVAAGKLLSMTKGGQTLAQAGGKWQVDGGVSLGNATVNLEGGTIAIAAAPASFTMTDIAAAPSTFNFKGGSHIGTPILLKTSGLNIMGATGAGSFILTGKSTLSGDIAAPQSVTVQGNNFGSHASVTANSGFTNAGALSLKSAISSYQSALTLTSGTLTISPTGVLSAEAGSGGTRTLTADLANYGTVRVQGTTCKLVGTLMNLVGSTLTGGAYEMLGGTFQFNTTGITTNAASILLDGAASGMVNLANGNALSGLGANDSAASFTIQNGRNVTAAGAFTNSGAVTMAAGCKLSMATGKDYVQDAGVTKVEGTLSAAAVNVLGGTLSGSGTVNGSLNNSAGTVSPGASPGMLTINGDYTQGAAGTLRTELNGITPATLYDRLTVNGKATLDGALDLSVGFLAAVGDSFAILENDAADLTSGTFSGMADGSRIVINDVPYRIDYNVGGGNDVTLTRLPVRIDSIVVDDNTAQRSKVRHLTITFDGLVTLATNAFELQRTGPGGSTGPVTLSLDTSASTATNTIANLTFGGPLTEFGSLIDGKYQLTVFGAQVTDAGGQFLDGDNNGTAGGDFISIIHRLFGDADGNAVVDTADFGAFRAVYGGTSAIFDFDGDGDVDTSDFAAFRRRFGSSV